MSELKRRKVFRVAAGYVVSAWLLIQVVETIFPAFGLDDAAFRLLVIALAIGLIPAVILAWAFELTRHGIRPDSGAEVSEANTRADAPGLGSVLRRPAFALPMIATLALSLGTIGMLWSKLAAVDEVRQKMLPEVERLAEEGDILAAYSLATVAEESLPDDPQLASLWPDISASMSFRTAPAGATVSYRLYGDTEGEWHTIGVTPVESVRLPRTVLQWQFEKDGYVTEERAGDSFNGRYVLNLREGTREQGLVHVPVTDTYFLLTGFVRGPKPVDNFMATRFEISNAEYLEFVSGGGYEDESYWQHLEFIRDGVELTFDEAMDQFRDITGRKGPSGWEGGRFAAGQEDYPVTGVSWFEAAAYAKYRDMNLPTIYEWSALALYPDWAEFEDLGETENPGYGPFRSELVANSNFTGDGPKPVNQGASISPFGARNAAGNVREWCWNATTDDPSSQRYILGGAWDEPAYLFTYAIARSPWDRSQTNGIRLVRREALTDRTIAQSGPVALPAQETIEPISDEIFAVYRDFYDYDRTPLNPVTESTDVSSDYWVHELVSFDATYGDERVLAHLFLPKNVEPPYQPVIYFSSSSAIYTSSSDDLELSFSDFLAKSGRALVIPVMMGMYERNAGLESTWPQETREYSEHVMQWIQDFRRTADYLETRPDIDAGKMAFYGYSWGGWNGPIVMALDDRFKAGIYISGGIPPTLARPEASSASFAARVTNPVLMISGKDDVLRPVVTYQAPMFESIGTADHMKRHAILDGGHAPPQAQVARESLEWLDRYLGPVE